MQFSHENHKPYNLAALAYKEFADSINPKIFPIFASLFDENQTGDEFYPYSSHLWDRFGFDNEGDLKMTVFMFGGNDLRALKSGEVIFGRTALIFALGWKLKSQVSEEKPVVLCLSRNPEAEVSGRLARRLKGLREVHTPHGRIDVLTDTEVIEVKVFEQWKAGLGQVLSYGRFYPNHKLRLHLFGCTRRKALDEVIRTCKSFNVEVTLDKGRKAG